MRSWSTPLTISKETHRWIWSRWKSTRTKEKYRCGIMAEVYLSQSIRNRRCSFQRWSSDTFWPLRITMIPRRKRQEEGMVLVRSWLISSALSFSWRLLMPNATNTTNRFSETICKMLSNLKSLKMLQSKISPVSHFGQICQSSEWKGWTLILWVWWPRESMI